MNKYFEEWNGKMFPVRTVMLPQELGGFEANIAGEELWDEIGYAYDCFNGRTHNAAVELDNEIYFYCEYGFIESDPTDEEIVEYLIKNGC
jgi:hypothetical protein